MSVLLTALFDCEKVHYKFLPLGYTVKKGYYLENSLNFRKGNIEAGQRCQSYRFGYSTVIDETQHCCNAVTTLSSMCKPRETTNNVFLQKTR